MFKNLATELSNYYNWLDSYSNQVVFEYERFMDLKNNNPLLIPPDEINKCWQYHILSTESYQEYCISRFKKFIHYNLDKKINKKDRINETINAYNKLYYSFKYPIVWLIYTNMNIYEHIKLNNIKLFIKDKILIYSCSNNDTINDLKHILSLQYNCNKDNIKICFNNINNIYTNNIHNIHNINQLYKIILGKYLIDSIYLNHLYINNLKEFIVEI